MDRNKLKYLGIIILLGVSHASWAGTVMANTYSATVDSADAADSGPGAETFPQSRFGHPPAKPDLGVTPGYATRAADDIDQEGSDGVAPSRSPAGLVFGNEPIVQQGRTNTRSPSQLQQSAAPAASRSNYGAQGISGVQEVALIANDLGFFPKTIFVSRDVPVRLFVTGASKNTLCIMMDSFQVRKQVRSQKIEEISFTPNMPGQYRFYCPVNGAEGALIVKELSSNLSVPPGHEHEGGVKQAYNQGQN